MTGPVDEVEAHADHPRRTTGRRLFIGFRSQSVVLSGTLKRDTVHAVLSNMTELRIGTPVTWHTQGEDVAGTITRIATGGTLFWFRTTKGTTYRATNTLDGSWREDQDCWPVSLGVATEGRRAVPVFETVLTERLFAVIRLEPWLLKRRWYPMSPMLIPGVKRRAEELATELSAWTGSEAERHLAAEKADHLRRLLRNFHRLP